MKLLWLAVVLCVTTTSALAETQALKLGGIFDLSAAGKVWGIPEKNGMLLAIEDFTRTHPATKLTPILEDSAYSNLRAVTALKKLSAIDGVRYVIGPTWEVFYAASPICEANRILCFAPSSNNQYFDRDLKWSFTGFYDERDYARVHLDLLNTNLRGEIGIVAGISPYYDAMVQALEAGLRKKPITIERVPSEELDFRQVIGRIPAEVETLVVFLLGQGAAPAFFKQWSNLRSDRPLIVTDDNAEYLEPPIDLPKLGFAVRYSRPIIPQSAARKDFEAAYQLRFGSEPGSPSAAIAYDLTKILLGCAAAHDPDREAVRRCVLSTEGYDGASGALSFKGRNRVQERQMELRILEAEERGSSTE